MVVDDEIPYCEVMAEILKSHGYEVRTAHAVPQATAVLDSFAPDLILMDVMMPGADGLSFVRELRQDHDLNNVPIIIISALALSPDRQRALDAGADEFLPKPFTQSELHEAIERYVNISV
jgi:two-component system sensor histidine kinase ChiS